LFSYDGHSSACSTLTEKDPRQLALELGVDATALEGYRPRYNIAPTDAHWILRT
jgi:hypothetical protein